MNYVANFNQTWWETCLRDLDSDLFQKRCLPLLGPKKGQNKETFLNLKKSSSHEPLSGMHWYLVWDVLRARRLKYVHMKTLGSSMSPPQGLKLLYNDFKECFKKCSSQDLLHQMGQYLAWIIPRTRRFKFVQIKSLGS